MDPTKKSDLCLLACNGNLKFAEDVARIIGHPLTNSIVKQFYDSETSIKIVDNIRGKDVFIIQSMCPPYVNDKIMEVHLMANAAKLASAKRITIVAPYLAYSRQDRKATSRVPISAKVLADNLQTNGAQVMLTVDLHCDQIQGFYNIPVNNMHAVKTLADWVRKNLGDELQNDLVSIVAPDAGGANRARIFADDLKVLHVINIAKRRLEANVVGEMQIIGDPTGRTCIIIDDMIDTGGTLCKAAKHLKDAGSGRIVAVATHGLFSNNGLARLQDSCIDDIIITDTVQRCADDQTICPKLHIVSLAPLFAQAIKNIHDEVSLSVLF